MQNTNYTALDDISLVWWYQCSPVGVGLNIRGTSGAPQHRWDLSHTRLASCFLFGWMSEMCFHRVIVSSPPHYLPGMQDWGCLATERKKGTGVRAAGVQCIKLRHIDRDSHRLKRTSSGWHTAAAWADVNHAVLTFTPLHRQADRIRCSSGEVCRRAQEF